MNTVQIPSLQEINNFLNQWLGSPGLSTDGLNEYNAAFLTLYSNNQFATCIFAKNSLRENVKAWNIINVEQGKEFPTFVLYHNPEMKAIQYQKLCNNMESFYSIKIDNIR